MGELRELGLTEYEEKVYMTLLKEGSLTGGKVSRLSGVPHGRTYEVLNSLAKKGFVSILPIKPKLFKAVSPEIAVREYIHDKIAGLHRLADTVPSELQKVKEVQIAEKWLGENITIVSGKDNMLKIIKNSIVTSKKYVKSMFTYELEPFQVIQAQQEAIKRGVKIRYIATKLTTKGLEMMKRDIARGIDVRYFPVQELRISIRDGVDSFQTFVNPINPKDRITIFVESQELTNALEHYFDTLWRKAKKVEKIDPKGLPI
ncbi:MAG: helix-turn-helix domain-containing protein [Candidatus Woesearchaeota archaeon]